MKKNIKIMIAALALVGNGVAVNAAASVVDVLTQARPIIQEISRETASAIRGEVQAEVGPLIAAATRDVAALRTTTQGLSAQITQGVADLNYQNTGQYGAVQNFTRAAEAARQTELQALQGAYRQAQSDIAHANTAHRTELARQTDELVRDIRTRSDAAVTNLTETAATHRTGLETTARHLTDGFQTTLRETRAELQQSATDLEGRLEQQAQVYRDEAIQGVELQHQNAARARALAHQAELASQERQAEAERKRQEAFAEAERIKVEKFQEEQREKDRLAAEGLARKQAEAYAQAEIDFANAHPEDVKRAEALRREGQMKGEADAWTNGATKTLLGSVDFLS